MFNDHAVIWSIVTYMEHKFLDKKKWKKINIELNYDFVEREMSSWNTQVVTCVYYKLNREMTGYVQIL